MDTSPRVFFWETQLYQVGAGSAACLRSAGSPPWGLEWQKEFWPSCRFQRFYKPCYSRAQCRWLSLHDRGGWQTCRVVECSEGACLSTISMEMSVSSSRLQSSNLAMAIKLDPASGGNGIHPSLPYCWQWKGIHPSLPYCWQWKGIHPAHPFHWRRKGIHPARPSC